LKFKRLDWISWVLGNYESGKIKEKAIKPLGMESMKYNNFDLTFYGQQIRSTKHRSM
jgi:hypothetical protein